LKYLQKLNKIISSEHADLFNHFFIKIGQNKGNMKKIDSLLCSIFIHEVISEELEENFINIKKLLNNLYNIENWNKIDEKWCIYIEQKYKITSEICLPYINNLSFLYFFVINDFENINDKKKGFLIDNFDKNNKLIDCLYNDFVVVFNKEIQNKKLNILILEIGNILSKTLINKEYINNLDVLFKNIKDYINSEKKIEDDKNIFKRNILNNFLKLTNIYLNYNNEESLIFDDIENENRKKLFSNKYLSLVNYLNNNDNIYQKMISENRIFNFVCSNNSIPLWLICLRSLANYKNIIVHFGETDTLILNFEKEFINKILEKIKKSNYIFQNTDRYY